MKIFEYDPIRGTRGIKIYDRPKINWTDQSVNHCVKEGFLQPIDYKLPSEARLKDQEWEVHVDAGRDESYLEEFQWICFCYGSFVMEGIQVWHWAILPPKSELIWIKKREKV